MNGSLGEVRDTQGPPQKDDQTTQEPSQKRVRKKNVEAVTVPTRRRKRSAGEEERIGSDRGPWEEEVGFGGEEGGEWQDPIWPSRARGSIQLQDDGGYALHVRPLAERPCKPPKPTPCRCGDTKSPAWGMLSAAPG